MQISMKKAEDEFLRKWEQYEWELRTETESISYVLIIFRTDAETRRTTETTRILKAHSLAGKLQEALWVSPAVGSSAPYKQWHQ